MTGRAFPVCVDEIEPAWLTEVLRSHGVLRKGRVARCASKRLAQHRVRTTSETYRLTLGYACDPGPDAPLTLIVKFASLDPAARARTHALGGYQRESRFHAQLAGAAALRTPRCYFADCDAERGDFALLLDDVDGEPGIPTLAALERTLCEIAKLHARYWNAPALAELGWLERAPDAECAFESRLRSVADQIVARTGLALPPAFRDALAFASAHPRELRELEHRRERTVVHGDLHPGQIITRADGPFVCEWQSATIGSAGRDVAHVIAMSLPPRPREQHEARLLAVYHAALERNGVRGYSMRDCYDDYQRGLVASAVSNAFAIAELHESELLAPRVLGEPPFLSVLIHHIDGALRATNALAWLRSQVQAPSVAA